MNIPAQKSLQGQYSEPIVSWLLRMDPSSGNVDNSDGVLGAFDRQ